MRGSKESEGYRLDMLRYLKEKYRDAKPPEVLEAEQVIAKFREEKASADAQIPRLEAGLPKQNLCPRCWFMDGHESALYAVPSDDPQRFDRWKCRRCDYVEDRAAR